MCKRPGRDDYSCDFELSRRGDIKRAYSAIFGDGFVEEIWAFELCE